jgi:uncharacterized protein
MKTLTVYVQPGAKRTRIVGLHDGMPKIALQARPVDGEANEALITLLANVGKTSKRSIVLVSGHTSRIKHLTLPEAAWRVPDSPGFVGSTRGK